MQNSVLQIQSNHYGNNICRSKSDSVLWRKDNERLKLDRSMKDSINLIINFGIDKSVPNIPGAKLQGCHQLLNSDSSFLYNDRSFHGLLSKHTSLSLPAISISSVNAFSVRDEYDNNTYTYRSIRTCLNEEETVFNQPREIKNLQSDLQCFMDENSINVCKSESSEAEYDKNDFKESTIANNISKIEQPYKDSSKRIVDSQLETNNIEISNEKTQSCENLHKENELNSIPTMNTRVRNNLPSRPTLAEDSKLVKMSLLTNPMNIMQSNVQLLNRSRNFLNFITEKSTNIMEKALLPQHLAMRYNHMSKSVETDTVAGALGTTNEFPLENITCKSDTILTTNSNNTSNATSCMVKQDHDKSKDKLDGAMNNRNKVNLFASIKENKIYDLEDEIVSNEKEYIFDENNIDGLDCNITNGQAKCDFSLIETNENKRKFLQVEKLHDDMYKTESSDIRTLLDSDISKCGSLDHPLHRMLLEDYTNLKIKHLKSQAKLLQKIDSLEKSYRSDRGAQTNTDTYNLQVENLEKTVTKLTTDLNASLAMQEALKNECTAVNKEKENMVMKYVISEKQLIDSQRYAQQKQPYNLTILYFLDIIFFNLRRNL